ncbi:hypothetical protein [Actinoplanes sp. NPDC049118]|uniref:hypothetical protein n=1 Tax=Actinoplanes sp. NPDC049118 TaxID=3155769 RepID=UPI003406A859
MVTSPNIRLSLENVPVEMAGAAGGALQTAHRIGGAIGTVQPSREVAEHVQLTARVASPAKLYDAPKLN